MKKFKLLAVIITALLTLTSCVSEKPKEGINIAVLKGPTGIGSVKLMDDNENGKSQNNYNFTLAGAPEDVVGKVVSGEIDIAAVPTNMAAVLYQRLEGGVKLAVLHTLGVLHIVASDSLSDEIESIEDLRGRTVYATGKGAMPEFVLNYILNANGIDPEKDLTIEYKTEHSELAALLTSGEVDIAMLPEPFVSTVIMGNDSIKRVLDITEEWDRAAEKSGVQGSILSMGCLVVRADFLEKNKEAFDIFLDEYKASIEFANNNLDETAALCEEYEIIPKAALAKSAIPNCNIVYIDGDEMADSISNLFEVLYEADPKSVGGAVPDEDFYYKK